MTPLLDYQDVTIYRNERLALDKITLSIDVGEHVAILGPNGCGKSTLIKTITRECYPHLAHPYVMRIMGQDTWNVWDLRAMLGIVTNDLLQSCTRDFTAREIVLSGFFSSVGVWPYHHVTPPMERKADQVMDLLEITHLASRWMDELSSGEAKRALVARSLVHDPKALVLDEPTNSLDIHATHELRTALRKVAQSGTSIVMVTHHLPDIIPEVDRVVFLSRGRVVRDGPKAQMLSQGPLSALFGTAVETLERDGYYQMW